VRRAEKLKIAEVHTGIRDKAACMDEMLGRLGIGWDEAAYIGDDLNDLSPMRKAAVSFAPSSATREARAEADIITDARGGDGAVREAVEHILRAKGMSPEEAFRKASGTQ
jgi:YrbI family 3-deoxy-D-manno-octulosonate 8-phosphate phosphatase